MRKCMLALGLLFVALLQATTSVTQYGMTWYFHTDRESGRFINNDYWVTGLVTVDSVTPRPVVAESITVKNSSGTDVVLRHIWMNGSVVDPVGGTGSGYDSRVPGFDSALCALFPLTLQPGQSLVSSISEIDSFVSGDPYQTAIRTAAVLTVVATAPESTAFRPPFCKSAGWKPLHDWRDVRVSQLPAFSPVAHMPGIDHYITRTQRPWIDHYNSWTSRMLHPRWNLRNYGGDIAQDLSVASLLLMIPDPRRNELLIHFLQIGIDYFGAYRDGARWAPAGGHHAGRKWPIVFAALMFEDPVMKGLAFPFNQEFDEDGYTWLGKATPEFPQGKPLWGAACGDYEKFCIQHIEDGVAKDCRDPDSLVDNCSGYRETASESYRGEALAARMMRAESLWNNPVWFAYEDRYVGLAGYTTSPWVWDRFVSDMWVAYRDTLTTVTGQSRVQSPLEPLMTTVPNPFTSVVRIAITGNRDNNASLSIVDIRGRQVADLTAMLKRNHFIWEAGILPNGVYLLQYRSDERKLTRKLVLFK